MKDGEYIKYVDVDGVRTRYFEKGEGDPLLLVHGGAIGTGSSFDIFGHNLEALADSFHVFALDKIGHGYTDNPAMDDDYTIECMTEHTHQFIRAMGLDEINLIGQSRGAFNGITLCLDHPDMIRAFVLCNSASMAPGVPAIPPYSRKVRAEAPFEPGTKEWVRYRAEVMCHATANISNEYVDEWHRIWHLPKSSSARTKMESLGPALFEPGVDAAKERVIGRIQAGELRVPTLVHWGKDDPSAPLDPNGLSVFNLLAENSSQVSMYIANHAGHFAFRERHEEFNGLVAAFFDALG